MDNIKKDTRFASIAKDPRFHQMKRKDRKVKIDKRFHGMFKDKQFKVKYSVDKRGRPIRTTTDENLKKYYDLSESDEDTDSDDNDEEEGRGDKRPSTARGSDESSDNRESDESAGNSSDNDKSDGKDPSAVDGTKTVDLARGEGNVETSSSSSESSDDEDEVDKDKMEKFDHKWGELDDTVSEAQEITHRLAICNLDWDRMKASDLFVLFNSFKPTGGIINSIKVYPSEFGKERMAEEDQKGPKELVEHDDEEDDETLQREKLRQYQLNRLRYYYAVMECDSPETANAIYSECDGIEYESSATKIDLRFIPNDMKFEDQPASLATSAPDLSTFKPKIFTTTALQQTKPDLTWDETDQDRIAVTMRSFTKEELENLDMKDYLASSESELDEDPYGDFIEEPEFALPKQRREKSKTSTAFSDVVKTSDQKCGKEKDNVELEITWDPDLKAEDLGKNKKISSPWEQFLKKKKEKKKKKGKSEIADDQGDKKQMKKGKTKKREGIKDNEEKTGPDSEGLGSEAFSDDELPDDIDIETLKSESNLENAKKGAKKNKKKKNQNRDPGEDLDNDALSLLLMDKGDDRQHFSLKKIMEEEGTNISKTRRKKIKKMKKKMGDTKVVEDTFEIDVTDARFSDVFHNPLYNIDPTAPEYKPTKATEALISEKIKQRQRGNINPTKKRTLESSAASPSKLSRLNPTSDVSSSKDTALASLVKSVKAKTQTLNAKKKR